MLINVRSSSSLPSSATTLSTSRPDTNPAPTYRFPYVLHRNLRNALALAISESGHNQPDAHLDQPSLERHSQQAHPDCRLPALLRTSNGLVE